MFDENEDAKMCRESRDDADGNTTFSGTVKVIPCDDCAVHGRLVSPGECRKCTCGDRDYAWLVTAEWLEAVFGSPAAAMFALGPNFAGPPPTTAAAPVSGKIYLDGKTCLERPGWTALKNRLKSVFKTPAAVTAAVEGKGAR